MAPPYLAKNPAVRGPTPGDNFAFSARHYLQKALSQFPLSKVPLAFFNPATGLT